jgi:hypothetical protein
MPGAVAHGTDGGTALAQARSRLQRQLKALVGGLEAEGATIRATSSRRASLKIIT